MMLRKMIKDGPRLPAAMDEAFEIAVDEAVDVLYEGPRNRLYGLPRLFARTCQRFSKGVWILVRNRMAASQYPT
jgi:hypothetical protein